MGQVEVVRGTARARRRSREVGKGREAGGRAAVWAKYAAAHAVLSLGFVTSRWVEKSQGPASRMNCGEGTAHVAGGAYDERPVGNMYGGGVITSLYLKKLRRPISTPTTCRSNRLKSLPARSSVVLVSHRLL